MDKKRTYFPPTTAQQRRLLFEVWEETGDRKEACRRAHVSEGTYYKWKPRFELGGYAALEKPGNHAPHTPERIAPEVEAEVVRMREASPGWGKQRIADELAKANNWVPVVSVNTVRRVLQDAGFWPEGESEAKKGALKTLSVQPKSLDNP